MKKSSKQFILFFIFCFSVLTIISVSYAATKVETKKDIITLPDTDGDGIIDQDDPHPTVAEVYIVQDDNLNGISDKFEK